MQEDNKDEIIILCEIFCVGFEHIPFNSAFLLSLLHTYPDSRILFVAESKHSQLVKKFLISQDQKYLSRIKYMSIKIPPRKCNKWQRMILEGALLVQILFFSRKFKIKFFAFCSATESLLLNLIILKKMRIISKQLYVVLHSILDELRIKRKSKIWNYFIQLPYLLQNYQKNDLKYVILGQSIFDALCERVSINNKNSWICINLPCIWENQSSEWKSKLNPIFFGYLGVVKDGFSEYLSLASMMKRKYQNNIEFILNGFNPQTNKNIKNDSNLTTCVTNLENNSPIEREVFLENAKKITYIIGCYDKEHYALTASATFLDSLSLLIPGIYKRNRFVEYYFDKLGDIGYLYDDYEELVKIVEMIMSSFPVDRYNLQVSNIYNNRKIFMPDQFLLDWNRSEFFN
jgi:hypothetical protein